MKKIPERTCIVSHEKLPKKDLIRIVNNKELGVVVDLSGKVNGHGIYIKRDLEVLEMAKKKKCLDKALDITVPDNIYTELESIINN